LLANAPLEDEQLRDGRNGYGVPPHESHNGIIAPITADNPLIEIGESVQVHRAGIRIEVHRYAYSAEL
jgi:hypothetical protein